MRPPPLGLHLRSTAWSTGTLAIPSQLAVVCGSGASITALAIGSILGEMVKPL